MSAYHYKVSATPAINALTFVFVAIPETIEGCTALTDLDLYGCGKLAGMKTSSCRAVLTQLDF